MILKKQVILVCTLMLGVTQVFAEDMDLETYRRICRKYPSDFICKQSLRRLNRLRNCITTCCDELDQLITQVEAETDKFNPCGTPTVIPNPFTTTLLPITEPGHYCLLEDIQTDNGLIIDADNVWLDLNGHFIDAGFFGIRIVDTHRNIAIRNGIIGDAVIAGIQADETTNLVIENVDFGPFSGQSGNNLAIDLQDTNNFLIRDCFFRANQQALSVSGGANGKVADCIIEDSQTAANAVLLSSTSSVLFRSVQCANNSNATIVRLTNSNSCVFEQCTINNNTAVTAGLRFNSSNNCFCINCEANQNPNATGFLVESSSAQIVFDACRSSNNEDGFILNQVNQNCIFNSFAKQNSVDGFSVVDGSNNYVHANTALDNTGVGFSFNAAAGTGNNIWSSNYAQANGTNYAAGIPGPLSVFDISAGTFTPDETAWTNIDALP